MESVEFTDDDFDGPDDFIMWILSGNSADDYDDETVRDEDFPKYDDIEDILDDPVTIDPDNMSIQDCFLFSRTRDGNPKIKSDYDMFAETYYLSIEDIRDPATFDSFIKACESKIRKSLVYRAYIAYLKDEIGLDRDVFNSHITSDSANLEMHHGPVFTLYDYVRIMIDYCLDQGIPVSDFVIASLIMEEHELNHIQVVMLTKNNHALAHAGKLNIDFRQCHGSIKEFLKIYGKYVYSSPRLVKKIQNYKRLIDEDKIHDTSFITPSAPVDWSRMKVDIKPDINDIKFKEIT
jgi:hypothetical protein